MTTTTLRPDPSRAEVVVPAPAAGPGSWSGAPSALAVGDHVLLAYRVRHPLGAGRGVAAVVARSDDGVRFETVARLRREELGAESLERPALALLDDGSIRLYLSCATPGSKHWWIEAVDAQDAESLPDGRRTVALPGDARTAVKDPVVEREGEDWRMWVCCHPLDLVGHEDRMHTRLAHSDDGLDWTWGPVVLRGREGHWDARGARVTAVLPGDGSPAAGRTVLYDGRATAEDNWHERTGTARLDPDSGALVPSLGPPTGSPHSDGALRYVTAVPAPDGRVRLYYELARPDGAHDLVTELR